MDITKRLDSLRAHKLLKLLKRILRADGTSWSQHARDEMAEESLGETDIVNTLRCGVVGEGELINGSWRYRVETERVAVVIAFQTEDEVVVVTAWRRGR